MSAKMTAGFAFIFASLRNARQRTSHHSDASLFVRDHGLQILALRASKDSPVMMVLIRRINEEKKHRKPAHCAWSWHFLRFLRIFGIKMGHSERRANHYWVNPAVILTSKGWPT
jgi:hypothetical protein